MRENLQPSLAINNDLLPRFTQAQLLSVVLQQPPKNRQRSVVVGASEYDAGDPAPNLNLAIKPHWVTLGQPYTLRLSYLASLLLVYPNLQLLHLKTREKKETKFKIIQQ